MKECTFTAVPHNAQALAIILSASIPVATGGLIAGRQQLGTFQ
jgi:hypothetical protein